MGQAQETNISNKSKDASSKKIRSTEKDQKALQFVFVSLCSLTWRWHDAQMIQSVPTLSPAQIKKKEAWMDDEKPTLAKTLWADVTRTKF